MLRIFLSDSRTPKGRRHKLPHCSGGLSPGLHPRLHMGITWRAWKIQRFGSYPWDPDLSIRGAAWALDFKKRKPRWFYDSQNWEGWLGYDLLGKANTCVEQESTQGRIICHTKFSICSWVLEMLSFRATSIAPWYQVRWRWVICSECPVDFSGEHASWKWEASWGHWVPTGRNSCVEGVGKSCWRPWARVLGCGSVLFIPFFFCPQSHNTPTDTMDRIHILSHGSLLCAGPCWDGPLVNSRYSESWVALISIIKSCGDFYRWLVMCANTREFLANSPKIFSSFFQESVRRLCDLSLSPTSTERRKAVVRSGWFPSSPGSPGKLPSSNIIFWYTCNTYPVTQACLVIEPFSY